MTVAPDLIRNVEVRGRKGCDVRLMEGVIVEIGEGLTGGEALEGDGGALIPGLTDHHIHLLGFAAHLASVRLDGVRTQRGFSQAIKDATAARAPGQWIRVVGYHEHMAGDLSRALLDILAPDHPMRVQHQTGSLWIFNTQGLALIDPTDAASALERDQTGAATGRLWRGDGWLQSRLRSDAPELGPVGELLSSYGVTAVTDASVTTSADSAAVLAGAKRSGRLPQRLTLMSGGSLVAPPDAAFAVGPVKILLDEHDLPDLEDLGRVIARARQAGRAVAAHCVTMAEAALMVAAFETFGAQDGDRIEHGGLLPSGLLEPLRRLGLTVVTQPVFIDQRGDRYLSNVQPDLHDDLYRCASLLRAGIAVAGSSDAPYGSADPWRGMRAATSRRTQAAKVLGVGERVTPAQALALYLGPTDRPGGTCRGVSVGAAADLCLLKAPLLEEFDRLDCAAVAATLIAGEVVHHA